MISPVSQKTFAACLASTPRMSSLASRRYSSRFIGSVADVPTLLWNASLALTGSCIIKLHMSLVSALAAILLSSPAIAARQGDPVKMFDTDNDGTLDLAEVKKAASALFRKLDGDHDGTFDKRELRNRLSAREFEVADPDHDGTLTLDEYLAVVEMRFKTADPDADGTLDLKELKSPAGRNLLRLLN